MTDKKKQIEEMAIIIAKQNCKPCGCENCDYAYEYGTKEESCEDYVLYRRMAEAFYDAGYRKPEEHEWEEVAIVKSGEIVKRCYECPVCSALCDTNEPLCPNCGAKMKGGAE